MKIIYRSDLEQLIRGCQEGKREAQKALFERYFEQMLAVCLRYTGNQADAEDLVQDGFIHLFKHIRDFRREGAFEGWMRRIFVTQSLMFCRKKKPTSLPPEDILHDPWEEDDSAKRSPDLNHLLRLLLELPEGYRNVFNLYVLDEYSHKEIADMLNISEGTSKSQLSRARKMLQEKIEAEEHKNLSIKHE